MQNGRRGTRATTPTKFSPDFGEARFICARVCPLSVREIISGAHSVRGVGGADQRYLGFFAWSILLVNRMAGIVLPDICRDICGVRGCLCGDGL